MVNTVEDVAIDEDEERLPSTTEVELRIDEDEDEAVLKLTTNEFVRLDVGLKFRSAA